MRFFRRFDAFRDTLFMYGYNFSDFEVIRKTSFFNTGIKSIAYKGA